MREKQRNDHQTHVEPDNAHTPPSFNSVDDHYQKYMGASRKKVNLSQLPTPIRWFAYFFYAAILAGGIALVVSLVSYYLIP